MRKPFEPGSSGRKTLVAGVLTKEDYRKVYALMDVAPYQSDCGDLCGKKCCQEYQPGVGMYLLPGEESMFTGKEPWLSWTYVKASRHDFPTSWKGFVPFIKCNGTCPRESRPIQCRTFPLMPYIDLDGNLSVRLDELSGSLLCPLIRYKDKYPLREEVRQKILEGWKTLIKDPLIRDDVILQSRRLDDDLSSPWRKLLLQE